MSDSIKHAMAALEAEQYGEAWLALKAARDERQAVLDCINLYGDEVLHDALDAIGWFPRTSGEVSS